MPPADSALDAHALARARRLGEAPPRREPSVWGALAAAGFAAVCALALAFCAVLAPPAVLTHPLAAEQGR